MDGAVCKCGRVLEAPPSARRRCMGLQGCGGEARRAGGKKGMWGLEAVVVN